LDQDFLSRTRYRSNGLCSALLYNRGHGPETSGRIRSPLSTSPSAVLHCAFIGSVAFFLVFPRPCPASYGPHAGIGDTLRTSWHWAFRNLHASLDRRSASHEILIGLVLPFFTLSCLLCSSVQTTTTQPNSTFLLGPSAKRLGYGFDCHQKLYYLSKLSNPGNTLDFVW
jgi:hypothetical protein